MKRINESEYGDMYLDYDMRRFAGYDKWKKKQDEIEQLKQDAKVDKNTAWKVADGRLKHKQDNLNMAFDDRKKHQQDWIDNGKKGVKQGLKNGEFKYHGKKHKWPSNNPVPFQRSDDEKEVLAKFDKEPFFNNETNESKNSMKKNIVKLNENTLRKIVAESVKKVLKEGYEPSGSYQPFEKDYKGISYETDIDKDRLHTLDIRRDGYGDGWFNPRTGKYEDSIEYYADGMPYPSIEYLEGHDDEWKRDRIYPELEGNKKLKESVEKAVKSVLKEHLNKK